MYEAVYEECLVYELKQKGLKVERQKDGRREMDSGSGVQTH